MSANGRLTGAELVAVQGGEKLSPKAAAAFLAMERDAAAAGKRIDIPVDGAYRTYERQAWMRAHPALYPGKVLAKAGTSNHGLGICVDIVGDVQWAIDNASRYGFTRPIKGDTNHFQHDGKTVPPAPQRDDEDDMKNILIRNAGNGGTSTKDGPGAGQVVLSDTALSKWVGLGLGYPELLKGLGLVENADGTKAPNLNVPANVFTYLQSIASPAAASVELSAEPVSFTGTFIATPTK